MTSVSRSRPQKKNRQHHEVDACRDERTNKQDKKKTKRADRLDQRRKLLSIPATRFQLQLGFLRGYPQHGRHGFNGLPIGAYSLTQLPGRWLVQAWPSGSLVVHWFNAIALGSFVPLVVPGWCVMGSAISTPQSQSRSQSSHAHLPFWPLYGFRPRCLPRPPKLSAVSCPSFLPVHDFFRPGCLSPH